MDDDRTAFDIGDFQARSGHGLLDACRVTLEERQISSMTLSFRTLVRLVSLGVVMPPGRYATRQALDEKRLRCTK